MDMYTLREMHTCAQNTYEVIPPRHSPARDSDPPPLPSPLCDGDDLEEEPSGPRAGGWGPGRWGRRWGCGGSSSTPPPAPGSIPCSTAACRHSRPPGTTSPRPLRPGGGVGGGTSHTMQRTFHILQWHTIYAAPLHSAGLRGNV